MKNRNTLKMTPAVQSELTKLRAKFKEKFGREPGPNDPIFFDPDSDTPTPITPEQFVSQVLKAAKSAGIDEDKARQFVDSVPNPGNANRFPNNDDQDD